MADEISFRVFTEPFMDMIRERERKMPRAAMWAVREAGRVAKREARAKAPVLRDTTKLSHAQLRKFNRAGFNTRSAYLGSQPIPGLLKASITPAKNVRRVGGEVSLKVGPRGERVHLYAGKIEQQAHFMAAGDTAATAALPEIARRAFDRVWKE